jgi:hypothetical protein
MILFYNNIPVKKTLKHIVGVLKQDKMDNRHTWVPVGDHEDSILSLLEKKVRHSVPLYKPLGSSILLQTQKERREH